MKRTSSNDIAKVIAVGVVVAGAAWAPCGYAGSGAGDAACPTGACCTKAAPPGNAITPGGGTQQAVVSTAALSALLRARTPATLLDARSGKWDDGKRITGAKTVNAESSEADIAAAAPDRNGLVVTYCSNLQCPASGKLAARLRTLGYANVMEYPEGIAGWIAAGNEVTETRK